MRLLSELRKNNPNDYRNYLVTYSRRFGPCIKRQDIKLRKAITAEKRSVAILTLVVILRLVAF